MTEQRAPVLRSVGRVVMSVVNGVLTLAATMAFTAIAALMVLTPKCPVTVPEYTAIPSDAHGKLEYCIAEAQRVPRTYGMRNNVVQPGAVCGPDKAELTAQAVAMTQKAAEDDMACNTRFLHEPHKLLIERGRALYQFVVEKVRPWFSAA